MRDPSNLPSSSRSSSFSTLDRTAARVFEPQINTRAPPSPKEPVRDRIKSVEEDVYEIDAFYKVEISAQRHSRLKQYYENELNALEDYPFEMLPQEDKVDWLLLKNYLNLKLRELELDVKRNQNVTNLLGNFTIYIIDHIESRQSVMPIDGRQAASNLTIATQLIAGLRAQILDRRLYADPSVAVRAARTVTSLQSHLKEWYSFYKDYDPLFTWWLSDPYPKIDKALEDLASTINEVLVGIKPGDTDTIVGEPIGRDGLLHALESEMIPYTPEELIEIGNKEYAWCETEMMKATIELGYEDWHDALEHVKREYVEPGKQPELVRKLIDEATGFVKRHDLVTVPQICEEAMQMFMMSPERQKMNPFFLGGDSIIVSYPTSGMSHEDKLMSMRGNNIHFARATAFHEMIPGHRLQFHYMKRVRPYRQLFFTPFCTEGWAFYWEMLLWDNEEWKKTPENRIGMLFWRMHRCARIIFSLKFHLGEMTPQECVDFLVQKVGHERATAEGEVRRSVMGDYGPLYQAGYMLGGLQIYALRKELLGLGYMKEKQFHDAFLESNQMPVELFKALITSQYLQRDFKSQWRFYEGL
ncbi:X-Pro dipeptidyl-peptidase [Zopfia rhizophila CBS 207.26]|uniref:X-Pro dipeptidyl-peptidase n=1 Tax=Zopfia rhizophila CBS 207.26 TaxID=1314779 RepID=A0A6A6EC04_9PEZI|nr:X-Pro dipeptidyl-peptidase [Zopfia rhizophila CBS 207.26]